MTRTIQKQLIAAQDIKHGVGKVSQQRGQTILELDKVDIPLGLATEGEVAAVSTTDYPRVRVGSKEYQAVNGVRQVALDIKPVEYVAGAVLTAENPYVYYERSILKRIADLPYTLVDAATDGLANLDETKWDLYIAASQDYVQEAAPLNPKQGARWYVPSLATTFVWYVDEDGGQWVEEPVQSAEGTLRDEIAADASSVLIGGVTAETIGRTTGAAEWFIPKDKTAASINAALTVNRYVVLSGEYTLEAPVVIPNNAIVFSLGAKFTKTGPGYNAFESSNKSGFRLRGQYEVVGDGNDKGISLFECLDYDVDNFVVHGFNDGFYVDGVTPVPGIFASKRGRQGRFTNPTAYDCVNGAQVLRRAEYTLWSNPQMTQNTGWGFIQEAGNTNVSGGNIQDNQNGTKLQAVGSTNACHGMFTGVNINHNVGWNMLAEDVIEGHTFVGCHFYGDSALAGKIGLIRSSGINISEGIIDAVIEIDGNVDEVNYNGFNRISGNQINTTYTTINSINGGREKTRISDNFQRNGDAWGFNDRAENSLYVDRTGATPQSLTSNVASVVIFNNVREDNRGQYNNLTGVYTPKTGQAVTVTANIEFAIAGGTLTRAYAFLEVAGQARAIWPAVKVDASGLSYVVTGSMPLALASSQLVQIKLFVQTSAGTITIPASVATSLSIVSSN